MYKIPRRLCTLRNVDAPLCLDFMATIHDLVHLVRWSLVDKSGHIVAIAIKGGGFSPKMATAGKLVTELTVHAPFLDTKCAFYRFDTQGFVRNVRAVAKRPAHVSVGACTGECFL